MSDDSATPSANPTAGRQPQPQKFRPELQICDASATAEQIAALVAVFAAMGSAEPAPKPASQWASHRRTLTASYPHGRGAWRASGLPR